MAIRDDGINLCRLMYEKMCQYGYFPALTGGLLYKDGSRKDIDIVIFRHRQKHEDFEMSEIEPLLEECGLTNIEYFGFVTKANWNGVVVDLFNPETKLEFDDGDYTG